VVWEGWEDWGDCIGGDMIVVGGDGMRV
jgi:hypothetical protein